MLHSLITFRVHIFKLNTLSFVVLDFARGGVEKGGRGNRTQADCKIISTLRFSLLMKRSKSQIV
jgi:hypothetical protein